MYEEFWNKTVDYEPVSHSYFALGEKVGNAFSDGKKLNLQIL